MNLLKTIMEVKMSKKIIAFTFILLITLIAGLTTVKVVKSHHEKELLVSTKYITEKARLCYKEKKCTNDTVTLKELYDLKYLDKQVNPVTKEYYNENSIIKKEDNNYVFKELN